MKLQIHIFDFHGIFSLHKKFSVIPYYKGSVFTDAQMINGYRVILNLQLFLDLYHFQPRGREHAEFLKERLEEKGKAIGQR